MSRVYQRYKAYVQACVSLVCLFGVTALHSAPILHLFQVQANIENKFATTMYAFKGVGGGKMNHGHLLVDASGRIKTNRGVDFTVWQKPPGGEETQVNHFKMKWESVSAVYKNIYPDLPGKEDEVITDAPDKIKASVDGQPTEIGKDFILEVNGSSGFNTVRVHTQEAIAKPTTGNSKLVVCLVGVFVSTIDE